MQDVTYYIFVFFVLLMSYVVIKTRSDHILIQVLIIIIFVGITGFRDVNVPDTPEYTSIYNSYNSNILDDQYIGQEIGFVAFGKILKNIYDSPILYFSVIALLNILLVRQAFKNLEINKCLGMLAYISFYGLYVNFIVLRVGIAMSLFLYFFSLYQKGNGVRASPILIFSTFFHKSIILPILILPITKFNGNRNVYFWVIFGALLFYFSGLSIYLVNGTFNLINKIPYLSKYIYYVDNIKITNGFSVRHIFNMLLLMVVIYRTIELEKIKPMLNVCIFGIVLTSLLSSFLWVDRMTDALVMFNIIILSVFALEKRNNKINEYIFYFFLFFNMIFISRVMTLFVFNDIF